MGLALRYEGGERKIWQQFGHDPGLAGFDDLKLLFAQQHSGIGLEELATKLHLVAGRVDFHAFNSWRGLVDGAASNSRRRCDGKNQKADGKAHGRTDHGGRLLR